MARSRGGVRCQVFRGSQPVLAPEDASTAGVPPVLSPKSVTPRCSLTQPGAVGQGAPSSSSPACTEGMPKGVPALCSPEMLPTCPPSLGHPWVLGVTTGKASLFVGAH